jgi:LAS superfamily LD-carboxypeptidase LdcB
MSFKIFMLLFLIFCNNNLSQTKMNLDILQGIKNPNLVGDSIKLEKNTFLAYKKMEKAALAEGIHLKIVSAYRGYDRQKFIWNRKFEKYTNEYALDPIKAIYEIIRFSTIPGTSRHHWGTEIDIIDKNFPDEKNVLISSKFEKGGIFYNVKKWLDTNSERFGFFITYDNNPERKGFEYEPWHYSYAPISKKMLSLFVKLDLEKLIKKDEISGSKHFNQDFIEKYKNEYILDINPELKN